MKTTHDAASNSEAGEQLSPPPHTTPSFVKHVLGSLLFDMDGRSGGVFHEAHASLGNSHACMHASSFSTTASAIFWLDGSNDG